jgi:leader peptidase (prepilin peptidase)/N-methyltransferase
MLIFWFVVTFVIGAAVGSFLNVCIYRIPYEKSLFWPSSHCGNCYQPIRWYDNLPLLSYWLLRGKCRTCKTPYSIRYFLVELGTALAFTGLFYAEIVENYLQIPYLKDQHWLILRGIIPLAAWPMFVYHALLICFLLVTSLCDADHMEVPLSVTVTGTVVGVIGGTLMPWPFPNDVLAFPGGQGQIPSGVFAWPLWNPRELPSWMGEGTWQLGLATSLAGALAGMVMLRAVRFIFGLGRGIEGMGMGDADLMMMAGSFIGWQPILLAFVAGVFPGLLFGLIQLMRKGDHPLPFVPPLAIGVVLTMFLWPHLGVQARLFFFDGVLLAVLAVFAPVALFVIAFALRLLRGGAQ